MFVAFQAESKILFLEAVTLEDSSDGISCTKSWYSDVEKGVSGKNKKVEKDILNIGYVNISTLP